MKRRLRQVDQPLRANVLAPPHFVFVSSNNNNSFANRSPFKIILHQFSCHAFAGYQIHQAVVVHVIKRPSVCQLISDSL